METSQLICKRNQLTGFYMEVARALNGLSWFYANVAGKILNLNLLLPEVWLIYCNKEINNIKRRRIENHSNI